MQAKRARRVPHGADARHDHFDLDANDATAESDFGETAHQQRPRLGVPGARAAPAHFPLVPALGHSDPWVTRTNGVYPRTSPPPRLDL